MTRGDAAVAGKKLDRSSPGFAASPSPRSLSGLDDRDIDEVASRLAMAAMGLRGARVLVTGATGWFGTWLLDSLVALDRCYGLDLRLVAFSRNPQRFARRHPLLAHAPIIEWVAGDVRDEGIDLRGALTHVIHAATESSTTLMAESAATMRATIVDGTRRIHSLARAAGATRFLFLSSGAVYGPGPFIENAAELPTTGDSYADGKRAAEASLLDAGDGGPACVIARCFAFVGPHMPLDAHLAIGNFIRDALAGGPVRVRGDGSPLRSYLYASDLVVWLLTILVEGSAGRIYNVGSSEPVSIGELAARCARAAGPAVLTRVDAIDRGGRDYVPDVARAREELDLRVDVPLDVAIARTMNWVARQGSVA